MLAFWPLGEPVVSRGEILREALSLAGFLVQAGFALMQCAQAGAESRFQVFTGALVYPARLFKHGKAFVHLIFSVLRLP
jgi:hypothetical protein